MNSLNVEIPPEFIVQRAVPTAAELGWGVDHGYVGVAESRSVVESKRLLGLWLTQAEDRMLALNVEAGIGSLRPLLKLMEVSSEPAETRSRVWMFLLLAWICDNRADFDDPLEAVALVYGDFWYPSEIASLVYWMPPVGKPPGRAGLLDALSEYVHRTGHEYGDRLAEWRRFTEEDR